MKYSPQVLLANHREDESSEDEMDRLFSHMLQIAPPPTLVNAILANVARLPLPQEMPPMTWGDVKKIVKRSYNDQTLS